MRLHSTNQIFNGHLQTTHTLLIRTDAQITRDYHNLNAFRGRILRSKRKTTLERIRLELSVLALEMGHTPPTTAKKSYLLNKIIVYKKQNSFLRFAAIHQAIINTCVIYEDFIKRIIMKYFEENIHRIPSKKVSLQNHELIEAILRGDNMHRTLAERNADDLMAGGVKDWHQVLIGQGMHIVTSPIAQELFLVRNCLVHNNANASHQLNRHLPSKYFLRRKIKMTVADVTIFKNEIHKSAIYIISEYDRLHPIDGGTWLS